MLEDIRETKLKRMPLILEINKLVFAKYTIGCSLDYFLKRQMKS